MQLFYRAKHDCKNHIKQLNNESYIFTGPIMIGDMIIYRKPMSHQWIHRHGNDDPKTIKHTSAWVTSC